MSSELNRCCAPRSSSPWSCTTGTTSSRPSGSSLPCTAPPCTAPPCGRGGRGNFAGTGGPPSGVEVEGRCWHTMPLGGDRPTVGNNSRGTRHRVATPIAVADDCEPAVPSREVGAAASGLRGYWSATPGRSEAHRTRRRRDDHPGARRRGQCAGPQVHPQHPAHRAEGRGGARGRRTGSSAAGPRQPARGRRANVVRGATESPAITHVLEALRELESAGDLGRGSRRV